MVKRSRDKKGFTATELLVAIAILGVVASVAVPSIIDQAPKMRVKSAARGLVADLRAARMKAVSERNNYVITFNPGGNTYTILDDDDNSGGQNGAETVKGVSLPNLIRFGRALGANTTSDCAGTVNANGINVAGNALTFQPDGTPTAINGSSVYVIPVEDANNGVATYRWRAVSVNITGRVKVWRYNNGNWR